MIKVQQFGTGTRSQLQILHQCGKRVIKVKSEKFWGHIPTFVNVIGEKLVGEPFWSPHHPDRVNSWLKLAEK